MSRYEVVVRTFRMRSTVRRKQSTPDLSAGNGLGQLQMEVPKVLKGLDPGHHRGAVFCSGKCHLPGFGAGRSCCGVNAGVGARRIDRQSDGLELSDRRLGVALVNPQFVLIRGDCLCSS